MSRVSTSLQGHLRNQTNCNLYSIPMLCFDVYRRGMSEMREQGKLPLLGTHCSETLELQSPRKATGEPRRLICKVTFEQLKLELPLGGLVSAAEPTFISTSCEVLEWQGSHSGFQGGSPFHISSGSVVSIKHAFEKKEKKQWVSTLNVILEHAKSLSW
jgi:hypothetical protein